MNDCVSILANTLTIVELDTTKWLTIIEREEIAALLSDTFCTLLTTERDELIAFFKVEHMKNGIREISELPDYQVYEYAKLIQRVALLLTNTILSLTNALTVLNLQFLARKVKK